MKVIHIIDEDTKLTKQEKSKVAILKLVDNGKYVEGVGIKDNDFYILTEDKADEMWLAHMCHSKQTRNLSNKSIVRVLRAMIKGKEIVAEKAKLLGKEPTEW